MAIPVVKLSFPGDPSPFCCPVCGHQIYTEQADGSLCQHVVVTFVDEEWALHWQSENHKKTFQESLEKKLSGLPPVKGESLVEYTPDDYFEDHDYAGVIELVASAINSQSAFLLAVSNYGMGCGGPTGIESFVVFDYQPQQEVKMIPLEQHGCYVGVEDGYLISAAMLEDGAMEDSLVDVTAPPSQEFLDDCNALFGTNFKMDQFAGR